MDPATLALIATVIRTGIELWATHAGKEPGWTPTQQELDDILILNDKTPEEFYKEAAARLGVVWPPRLPLAVSQ